MEINKEQADKFDLNWEKACKQMKGLVILGEHKPKDLNFFEKIRINRALSFFTKGLYIIPDHWQSLFFSGKIYQRMHAHSKSLLCFEKAMRLEKENFNIPLEASLEAMHLGKIELSINYSSEAIIRNSEDPGVLGNHSMYLLISGRYEEALQTIENALSKNKEDKINQKVKEKILNVISGKEEKPHYSIMG